jgi:hypothetical protein
MLDRAVFARRVQRLKDDQQRVGVLCVEHRLQISQLAISLFEQRLRFILIQRVRLVSRVKVVLERDLRPWTDRKFPVELCRICVFHRVASSEKTNDLYYGG